MHVYLSLHYIAHILLVYLYKKRTVSYKNCTLNIFILKNHNTSKLTVSISSIQKKFFGKESKSLLEN